MAPGLSARRTRSLITSAPGRAESQTPTFHATVW